MPENGWNEYQKLVLSELTRHSQELEEIRSKVTSIELALSNDITAIKVKSGVWGAIAGMIPVCILIIFYLIKG